jgi:hypothetical protein
MPLSTAITASATALDAQRARIEVAVSNIANAESTRGPDGQPYRRRDVVLRAEPIEPFGDALGKAQAIGVTVNDIVEDQAPFRRRYEPASRRRCRRVRRHANGTCPRRWRHPRVSGQPDRHQSSATSESPELGR